LAGLTRLLGIGPSVGGAFAADAGPFASGCAVRISGVELLVAKCPVAELGLDRVGQDVLVGVRQSSARSGPSPDVPQTRERSQSTH
jgi:hypothetical protein